MKSKALLIGCVFITTGCVTIKAPENLISDSVKAGKDIYHSVKGEVSETKNNTFEFSYLVPTNEPHETSSNKCFDGAIEKARKALNKYNLEVKKSASSISLKSGETTMNCSVSV